MGDICQLDKILYQILILVALNFILSAKCESSFAFQVKPTVNVNEKSLKQECRSRKYSKVTSDTSIMINKNDKNYFFTF